MVFDFLGTGMIVETLKQAGTRYVSSEKMSVNIGDSWSAQCSRVEGEAGSGPAALRVFCLLNSHNPLHSEPDMMVFI